MKCKSYYGSVTVFKACIPSPSFFPIKQLLSCIEFNEHIMSPMDKIKMIIVMAVRLSKIQNSISFKILVSKLKKRILSEPCYSIIALIRKSVIIIGCTVSKTPLQK